MERGVQEESVQQFCAVTAASPQQAQFFLESCAWELETAIQSFFEDDGRQRDEEGEEDDADVVPPGAGAAGPPLPPLAAAGQNRYGTRSGGQAQGAGAFGAGSGGSRPKSGKEKASTRASSGRGGITTLSDLNKQPESDSDSDGPQEYYTGGEKSGMMVQDPTHRDRSNRDVDSIFERARQFGAREGIETPPVPSSRGAFTGQGRTLSGSQPEPVQGQAPAAPGPPQAVFHTITFWRNGFTVDDGPLRRLDDPANAPFLASINKTECPRELEPADRKTPVHVNLVRKDEDFEAPPEPKYVAFQGTGRTLGSSSQSVEPTPAVQTPALGETFNQPSQGLVVDDTKPITSIQLRLQDGTRLVARFNHSHTVADIRRFIDAARPGHSIPYNLQSMGFPPKQLSNSDQTISEAGLINAVVIQK